MISFSTAGGPALAVIRGTVRLPRIGAWGADLVLNTEREVTGAVQLQIGDTTLVGAVLRGAAYGSVTSVRITAGKGGLAKTVTARHLVRPSVGAVLRALAADAGETVAPSVSLAATLDAWTVLAMPAGQAIRALLDVVAPAASWRYLPDGKLWAGAETWPESTADLAELSRSPESATLELGAYADVILPGETWDGLRADYVELTIEPEASRARVWWLPE